MSNSRESSLEERLAKRRRVRNIRFLDRNSVDESETNSINRKSSKGTITTPLNPQKSSSATTANSFELPAISAKQTPSPQQVPRKQWRDLENNQRISLPTGEQLQNYSQVIATTRFPPITSPEKPMVVKEPVTPIVLPTTVENSDLISRETHGYSIPIRMTTSEQHFASEPQSTTDHQPNHFNYSLFRSKPITRTISEEIVSVTKNKHPPVNPTLAKQNSLALPYLFNKRLVNAELSHAKAFDAEQSRRKTVWE